MGGLANQPPGSREQQHPDVRAYANDGELFRHNTLFPSLIEAHARLQPSRVCLISSAVTYDFATLWNLVVWNAKRFLQHGVDQTSRVAVVSESSPAAIVALLAVLKVGAVCVPLSSSLPESRLQTIARIGGLTHQVAIPQHAGLPELDRLHLDLDLKLAGRQQALSGLDISPVPAIDPNAPALVIFTSGSTGEPKGVVHSHASLSTMALAVGKGLDLTGDERNFLFPSFGWAVNTIDSFSTLAAGGCLCMPTEAEKSQGVEDAICRFRATRTTLPASVLGIMEPSSVPTIRSIVLAGEPMQPGLVESWIPHVSLYWNYGSSEAMMVLAGKVTATHKGSQLNSGYALASCRCYIVGDGGNELLPGRAGQLVVEGHSNFMGYLRDGNMYHSELGRSGCSIVRSGDLFEQHVGTGAFVHRGRIDSQLKISGQRFEPQEVENKMWSALTGVKELAVTVATLMGNARGPALVVAVVLEHHDDASSSSPLQCAFQQLVETLPTYMIPVGALRVDHLPRLHNGKLDRRGVKALAERQSVDQLLDLRPLAESETSHESMILTNKFALVWAKVLGLPTEEIKHSSGFFLLGGSSLYAMRACRELRKVGIPMSISDFFLHPTLGGMVRLAASRDQDHPEVEQLIKDRLPIPEVAAGELYQIAAEQCKVDKGQIENVYPCTPMQAALMTLSEVQKGAYVAEHRFQLPKSWTRTAFAHAWERVEKATPILRGRIVRHPNGRLYNVTMRFQQQDEALPLQELPRETGMMTCGSRLFLHALEADQEQDGLAWRWRVHHAMYDRWSTNLILDMVQKEYGQTGAIVSSTRPFSVFAEAVNQQQHSVAAKDFWHSKLESFAGSVFPQLPLDHFICRASQSIEFECRIRRRRCGTTQATSIQGALALLISKMHGESDVVFGMTVHGRAWSDCPDSETVVGPAIATVPMRIRLDGLVPLHVYLDEIQTQAALMSDYEHYSLQNIKSIGPGSTAAASFTTLLIIQSDMEFGPEAGPERIVETKTESDLYVDYPLVVECFPDTGGIRVRMQYDPLVLSAWDVQMMAKQFEQLLHEMECTADPSTAVIDLKLLSSGDAADVIQKSCQNLVEHHECLHDRIFANSEAQGWEEEDALHGWDAKYTYGQLRHHAQALARGLLQRIGDCPGEILPICYPKSAAAVLAMLAALLAGRAFLMIDPALPAQRIQYMLEAVGAHHIVCSPETIARVQEVGATPINFEDMMHSNSDSPALVCSVDSRASPESPAYCIFTSGSTGAPKGVLLLHKQVTSGLEAQCRVGLYPRGARILQFSSYSFDTCIADIFATFLSGGCVCVPKDEDRLARISDNINAFLATAIDLTPSVARMMQPDDVPCLEVLRLGGEAMHAHHVQAWASRCNLQNTYGPTECCVQCTFVDRVQENMSPSVIGKGIGCNTWIVDPQNHKYLVPLGAIGELAIQGPAVAVGYINNRDKTKASFLPTAPWLDTYKVDCAFATYLTGDLVKFNEQSQIVFIGRRDNQIKIRGQRVEPEEIEHMLQQDPSTEQAIVCYPTAGVLASQLVAILEPSRPDSTPLDTVAPTTIAWMEKSAQQAAEFLPQYMVPAVYLTADRTLLMASGKLDRRSMQVWLERISAQELRLLKPYYRANNNTPSTTQASPDVPESVLSPIVKQIRYLLSWRSGNQKVEFSTHHSFSRIGLDSITVVPLLKWINKTYQAHMDMQTLLRLETAHALACHLDGQKHPQPNNNNNAQETFQDIIAQGVDQLCRTNHVSSAPRRVLLTGASSLVGLNILLQLLHQFPTAHVAVLIRCPSTAAGKTRLLNSLKLLTAWNDTFTSRIDIWPGDLAQPRLGLSPTHWLQLGGNHNDDPSLHITAIIHNGASVNWFETFQALKRPNIEAALQLIECARDSPAITRLVYISGGPQWDPLDTDTAPPPPPTPETLARSNPYGQTKLLTTAIIHQSAARLPQLAAKISIIRPALIIGSSADGIPNIDDYIWRVVLGCHAIRAFPREEDPSNNWIYLTGADRFAKTVVDNLNPPPSSSSSPQLETRINNGLTVSAFWQVINDQLAPHDQLRPLDYTTWLGLLKADILLSSSSSARNNNNTTTTHHHHRCQPIEHMLESSRAVLGAPAPHYVDPAWEDESVVVVRKNIEYMVEIGYFSSSSSSSSRDVDESVWSGRVFDRRRVASRN